MRERILEHPVKLLFALLSTPVAAAAKSLQSCPTVRPQRWQPIRIPHPWDSPGKNTGVHCHFLLQCVKVKSESEVAQSCPTLSDPMDCSPPGSSIPGIFQAGVLEWGAIAFPSRVESVWHLYSCRPGILPKLHGLAVGPQASHSLLNIRVLLAANKKNPFPKGPNH